MPRARVIRPALRIVLRAYRVMTFNCDVSSNHGRLTDSDTLWRAVILHVEKRGHPPRRIKGEKDKKKKKEERKESQKASFSRGDALSR